MSKNIRIFNFIGNIFFRHNCIFCEKTLSITGGEYYCRECKYKINIIDKDNRCLICGREIGKYSEKRLCETCLKHNLQFDASYPCFKYSGVIRELIHKYKFRNKMFLFKPIADFMIANMEESDIPEYDYIVYPPINRATFIKREYNHTKLISKCIGKHFNKKVLHNAIYKTRQNHKQSFMTKEMRFENVKGVFAVKRKYKNIFNGKNILVIDDVLTTGATASEIAKVLKENGAFSVYVTVFAVSGG